MAEPKPAPRRRSIVTRRYAPVTLAMIEEGDLLRDAEGDFRLVCQSLASYVAVHPLSGPGTSATLTLKVRVSCDKKTLGTFVIEPQLIKRLPDRPKRVTIAQAEVDDNGVPDVFARPSGTDEESPAQGKMFTATDPGAETGAL